MICGMNFVKTSRFSSHLHSLKFKLCNKKLRTFGSLTVFSSAASASRRELRLAMGNACIASIKVCWVCAYATGAISATIKRRMGAFVRAASIEAFPPIEWPSRSMGSSILVITSDRSAAIAA